MKIFKYLSFLLVAVLPLAACDDLFDDDEDDGSVVFTDFMEVRTTRCERVGSVLMVEFTMKNKTGETKTVSFNSEWQTTTDDLNNTYRYKTYCAFGESDYDHSRSVTLRAGESVTGSFKVKEFDTSNNARKVSISVQTAVSGEEMTSDLLTFKDLAITDNRVLDNGIQTCDQLLAFELLGCERVGSVLVIDYEVSNLDTAEISNFTVNTNFSDCMDNLNNKYSYNCYAAFGASDYAYSRTVRLPARGKVQGHIKVTNFDAANRAETVSLSVGCEADSRVLEDERYRFINIPVTDNRVLNDGIQTCDRALAFSVKSCTLDEAGNLLLNYSMKNVSDRAISGFSLNMTFNTTDDLNNKYDYDAQCAFGNQDFGITRSVDVPAGATIDGYIRVEDFDARAASVSLRPTCSATGYVLDDTNLRFLNIAVQK